VDGVCARVALFPWTSACVAELDETVLATLQRGVHEAGWKILLTGTVEPLEENEWTSTLDAAMVPGADSIPHFCARVDRVVHVTDRPGS
jgi:hypothetical protein